MPGKATFRSLVVAQILLLIGSAAAFYVGESSLPEALREFSEQQFEQMPTPTFYFLGGVAAAILVMHVVAWIGLFLYWRPARWLYLMATVAVLLPAPFLGPYVETGLSYMLAHAGSMVAGVILALVYWSPLKVLYVRPKPLYVRAEVRPLEAGPAAP